MNDREESGNTAEGKDGDSGFQAYQTPGSDSIIESTSSAVPSPSISSEDKLSVPKPIIGSIGEMPGDANPALVETMGAVQGQVSTADLLRARESAEEQGLRAGGNIAYQEQSDQAGPGTTKMAQTDTGRPNWPDERKESPAEYMESPRADAAYGASAFGGGDLNLRARADAAIDRESTQSSAQESRSGLAPVGMQADEDKYEEREFGRPSPPSDLEITGGSGMLNIPSEDKGDE